MRSCSDLFYKILFYQSQKSSQFMDFISFMEEEILNKKKQGKIKTAKNYEATRNTLLQFLEEKKRTRNLEIEEFDADLMKCFERYLFSKNICKNSTSFYMRILRAVYNRAVSVSGITPGKPFSPVYTGIAKTVKRAVDIQIVQQIMNFKPKNASMEFARDAFLFCFFSCGMAFIDMAKLTPKNIQNGRISYYRSKTDQLLSIKIEPVMEHIIRKYHHPGQEYLFPILNGKKDLHTAYHRALRLYNLNLYKIGLALGEGIHLTSYVPRHSWASIAHEQKISMNIISESLGHCNEKTTSIYIKSLSTKSTDQANERIMKKVFSKPIKKKNQKVETYSKFTFCRRFYEYRDRIPTKNFTYSFT